MNTVGKWEYYNEKDCSPLIAIGYRCNVCGDTMPTQNHLFCPHCGSMMQKDTQNERIRKALVINHVRNEEGNLNVNVLCPFCHSIHRSQMDKYDSIAYLSGIKFIGHCFASGKLKEFYYQHYSELQPFCFGKKEESADDE